MAREIELRLKALLAATGMAQAELAKRVGVGKATMSAYCANRWTVLDRTVLERMADVLQCDAGSLLTTAESRFFDPYRPPPGSRSTCIYLRRPDAENVEIGRPVGRRDYRAIGRVTRLLENAVGRMNAVEDSVTTLETFNDRVRQNCVVLGSPMVNAATNLALCRTFGVDPFHSLKSGKLPFCFRADAQSGTRLPGSIIEPTTDERRGIWLTNEHELLQPEVWPPEEFYRTEIKKGRDCAVIVVLNHETPDPSKFKKLIVLAGFGGVGTEGAAMALVDHYRDLEPRGKERCVWGVIDVFYRKSANDNSRDILGYTWRCRRGGRCPIALTFRKSHE